MTRLRQALDTGRAIVVLLSWIALIMLITRGTVLVLGQFPFAMSGFLAPFGLVAAWGAIIAFSDIVDQSTSWTRGYRIRPVDGPIRARILGVKYGDRFKWAYEESALPGDNRELHFVREIVGRAYPAPNHVYVPSTDNWDSEVPSWAMSRRSEILERIREAFGRDTIFVDRAA